MEDRDWIEGYLDSLRVRGLQWTTIRDRRYNLRAFWDWIAARHLSLEQLDAHRINEYLCVLKSKGHTPATLASDLDVLRDFMRYAVTEGGATVNPTEGVSCVWLDVPGGYPTYRGVLRKIFCKPAAAAKAHLTLFAPYWERYLQHLRNLGYSHWHVCKTIQCLIYFHRFLSRRGLRLRDITPVHLKEFLRQQRLQSGRYGPVLSRRFFKDARRYIGQFLSYALGWKTVAGPLESESRVLPAKLLASYSQFFRSHRGIRSSSLQVHIAKLKEFGLFLDRRGLDDIRNLSVQDLDSFLFAISNRMKPVSLRGFVSCLRSLLRYLQIQGFLRRDLARLVISPMRFSRDRRPKYLSWKKVQQMLAGIDRSVLIGKRDYAILTLMACHGLRNGEVGALLVADIDWTNASILLRERKGSGDQAFPISPSTLQALRDYLAVRPAVSYPQVFLTVAPPIRPVGSNAGAIVNRRLRRCFGAQRPHYGAHILRHSFAKALLDQGAKITDVKELLGHKNLESTHIYTHIATNDLREVADNYAGLLLAQGNPT